MLRVPPLEGSHLQHHNKPPGANRSTQSHKEFSARGATTRPRGPSADEQFQGGGGSSVTDPYQTDPGDEVPGCPRRPLLKLIVAVDGATGRLRGTAAAFSDEQVREPSRLPGWSRGTRADPHRPERRRPAQPADLGAHRSRDAAVRRPDARERGIEAGAGRPVRELLNDLDASADALAAEAASLRAEEWASQVQGLHGDPHPAWFTLWRRRTEVEIHHVDLGAGYRPDDWPEAFAATLPDQRGSPTSPGRTLRRPCCGAPNPAARSGSGLAGATPAVEVTGPASALLAWLIGRGTGDGLTTTPAGPLPALPPW